jgi:hypothetical protein
MRAWTGWAAWKVVERELCSYRRGSASEPLAAVASPDGQRVAHRFSGAAGEFYRVDDRPQPAYEAVSSWFVFGGQGSRTAYAARADSGWCVVVDSIPGPWFDSLGDAPLQFSADGRHFAYAGVVGGTPRLVFDHAVVPGGDRPSEFQLSRDGGRIAWLAWRNGRCRVFVNGVADPEFDGFVEGSLRFSPDGRRLGYVALLGQRIVTVLDGAPRDTAESASGPYFSADGRRAAFALLEDGRWAFAEEGRSGPAFDRLNVPVSLYSPDATHTAYVAQRQGRRVLVTDDRPGDEFDVITPPRYAPSGSRLGCFVKREGRWAAWIDGKTGPTFDDIGAGGPVFSPDGARVAYLGRSGETWRVVLDGVAGPPWERVFEERLCFGPDGRHLAYAALDGGSWSLILDGRPAGPRYDALFVNGPAFRSDGTVGMLAARQEGEVVRVFRVTATPPSR